MKECLSSMDWLTILAFIVAVVTIVVTTLLTMRNQDKAVERQKQISEQASKDLREKSRVEFISKSRQDWINQLRESVSLFTSNLFSVFDLYQQKNGRAEVLAELNDRKYAMSELAEWSIRYGTVIAEAQKNRAQIFLLLNPIEPLSVQLMEAVDCALDEAKKEKDPSTAIKCIRNTTQLILKNEWERVKALDGR